MVLIGAVQVSGIGGFDAASHIDALNTPVMSLATPSLPTGLPFQSGIQSALGSGADFSIPAGGDLPTAETMTHSSGLGHIAWTR